MNKESIIKEIAESKEKAIESLKEKSWNSFLSYVGRIHVINKEVVTECLINNDIEYSKIILKAVGSSLIEIEEKLKEICK